METQLSFLYAPLKTQDYLPWWLDNADIFCSTSFLANWALSSQAPPQADGVEMTAWLYLDAGGCFYR